jgi:hypothetical protein
MTVLKASDIDYQIKKIFPGCALTHRETMTGVIYHFVCWDFRLEVSYTFISHVYGEQSGTALVSLRQIIPGSEKMYTKFSKSVTEEDQLVLCFEHIKSLFVSIMQKLELVLEDI